MSKRSQTEKALVNETQTLEKIIIDWYLGIYGKICSICLRIERFHLWLWDDYFATHANNVARKNVSNLWRRKVRWKIFRCYLTLKIYKWVHSSIPTYNATLNQLEFCFKHDLSDAHSVRCIVSCKDHRLKYIINI